VTRHRPTATRFRSLARAACSTSFVLLLAGACGGQSFKGGEGNAGSGGTAQTAGGKATGGDGSGTTAGTGSTVDREACTGPSEANLGGSGCAAALRRWWHDEATGLCVPVMYGGCNATKNNYETLAACQQACPHGNPNYDTCRVATDCLLGNLGCCGVCDGPGVTAHDFIAYNKQDQAKAQACTLGGVTCGSCPPVEPMTNTRPYFVPNCVRGECVVEDIRENDVTACKTSEDCRVRNGTACCQACGFGDVVAVRRDGSLERLVCDELPPTCLDCVAVPPEGAEAQCNDQGRCVVRYLQAEQTP
jgi:hypothetical protein